MGGCSSKPKTTEFEGPMDLQDDKPHNEPSIKSLVAEKKGLDSGLKGIDRDQKSSSENCLKTLWVENKRGNLQDVLLESEKQPIAGFSSENNAKNAEEKSTISCDQSSAKDAERETLGAQNKHSIAEGETRTPAIAGREIGPDGEALKLQKEPAVPVAEETLKLQKEPIIAEEETVELQKEPIGAGGKTLELQKESIVSEKGTTLLQEESHGEVEERKQSQTQEDRADAGPGYGGGAKQGEEVESKEGEVVNYGAKKVVCNVDSATDNGTVVQSEERKGEIVKKALPGLPEEGPLRADESPRDEEVVVDKSPSIDTPTTNVPDCTVEEDQKQTQEADQADTMSNEPQESSAEPHAELTGALIENSVAPDTPFEDDSLVRVLSTEASNTTSAEGELNLEETSVEGQKPTYPVDVDSSNTEALIFQEPALTEVPKEIMDSVEGQQMSSPIICDASKLEGDVSSNSVHVKVPQDLEASEGLMINHEEHFAASQPSETTEVNATTENSSQPNVKSVHVAEGNEPPRPISSKGISAQDITPPDIDEVLEKLASEFQRQESLCSSMP